MLKVFVDSDVIISSLISSTGAAHFLLHQTTDLELFISSVSKRELDEVVARLSLENKKLTELIDKRITKINLKEEISEIKSKYEDYVFGIWDLALIETGRFIGDEGITYQTVEERKPLEIGYHIHPLLRGLGYATEAAHACIEWGFLNLGADFICSIVDPANAASIKVASRVHTSQRGFKGKKGPMLLFNTTAEQYKARPSFVYRKTALAVDKNKP